MYATRTTSGSSRQRQLDDLDEQSGIDVSDVDSAELQFGWPPIHALALPFRPRPLRRASGEPLYAQVARDLATHVRRGTMAPGGADCPAEPVLARAYGVNRLTVREALTSLTRQGLVRRVQGVGSFVADAPVRHRIGGRTRRASPRRCAGRV